jgi:isopropylmalate/homocitrate/citramalate synthase/RimJ/RimL family protein N-acetyltransferase
LSEIWTGALNDGYRVGGSVGLYDTTLRDGEQTVGVVLDPEQKLEIAKLLDELGIDRIEAGFPRVSQDDWDAVKLIAGAGLRAQVWGFSRAVPADLEALVELGVPASVIESPISDLKLNAIGVDREKMLGRITDAMRFAAEHGIHAAFFGVDSTRAEPDFYERVYVSAVEAGAKEVVVVDTLGIASPEAVAELVGKTVEWVGPGVPVHFHGHNDFGLATAAAVAAVRAGATWIQGTINGMGERAGNANLGELAMTLRALYGVESNLRLDRIRDVSARVQELSGYALEPWKPVTGETLFRRESGAVASQFHDPPSIEPYSSNLVAAERGIVLGKKSGLDSIRIKAGELGLDVPEDRRADLLARVKEHGMRKRALVTDDEFRELVETGRVAGKVDFPADGLVEGAIRVRSHREADLPVLVRWINDEDLLVMAGFSKRDRTESYLRGLIAGGFAEHMRTGESATLAIADGETDTCLGQLLLFHFDLEALQAELGFWLVPDARGRGAASSAARAAAHWALTDGGLRRIEARASTDNAASLRALERAGFVREGVRRSDAHPRRDRLDMVSFSILSEDIEAGG